MENQEGDDEGPPCRCIGKDMEEAYDELLRAVLAVKWKWQLRGWQIGVIVRGIASRLESK